MSEYDTFDQIVENGDMTHHIIDGDQVSTAIHNVFGGDDYYSPDQHLELRTAQNVFGDKDFYDAEGHLIAQGIPNIEGGHTLYSGNDHQLLGHSQQTTVETDLIDASGNLVAADLDLGHGFHEVMHDADPLLHAGDYTIPDLDLM